MGGQQGIAGMMLPLAMFAAIFYFMIIRPQKKKQKAHDEMIASIARGSMVVTAGGFFGTVREILDDSYIIELDDNTRARILKSSISVKRDGGDAEPKPRKKKKKIRKLAGETGQAAPEQELPESAGGPAATEEAAEPEPVQKNLQRYASISGKVNLEKPEPVQKNLQSPETAAEAEEPPAPVEAQTGEAAEEIKKEDE